MGRRAKVRLVLRTDDLARMFGVTSRTITRWIASGRLPLMGDPLTDFRTIGAHLAFRKAVQSFTRID